MSTTHDISNWYADGQESAYDFMLIAAKKNDDDVIPVYAYVTNYADKIAEYERLGYHVLEVYDLAIDLGLQIKLKRAYFGPNTPAPPEPDLGYEEV